MAIDADTLLRAIMEAEKFSKQAQSVLNELIEQGQERFYSGTSATGAVRRRSMDLSKVLIELRKS